MYKMTGLNGFEYSVKFRNINNPKDNFLAQVRTKCILTKLATEEVFVGFSDCSKKDFFDPYFGRSKAFENAIVKLTKTEMKQSREKMWVEFFTLFDDPHKDAFFNHLHKKSLVK